MVGGILNRKTLKPEHKTILRDVDIIAYEIMGSDLSKIQQFKKLEEL